MITTPRITATWMFLVTATILSWWLGHDLGVIGGKATALTILVITFVKVRFVVMEFMEVRRAPLLMRAIAHTWLVALCSILVAQLAPFNGK
jgi:hypothetical protein